MATLRVLTTIAMTLIIAGCAGPFALRPSVAAPPGRSPGLPSGADEVEMCRGAGAALRCSCTATTRVSL